jgi:hypothetical protein
VTRQDEFLGGLIERLEKAGIPYMVAGSVGSSLHGRPRATQDVDVVIAPTQEQLDGFVASLGETYYVSPEAVREALQHRTMFNVIDIEAGWKADLVIRKTRPFSVEEFQRRRRVDVMGRSVWVVSPEDVILSKLEWAKGRGSEVQFSDALGVAILHYEGLDLDYLRKWAKEIGVEGDLARLLGEAKSRVERPEGGRGGGD